MTHKIEARTWASKLRVLVDTEDGPQTVCEIPNPNPGELLSVVVGGWGDEVQTGYLRSVFVEPSGSQTIGELTQYEVNGVTPVRSAQGTTELPKVTATGGDIFEVVVDGEIKSRHSKQHVAQYEATKWEQASPSADVIYKKETVWRVEATPLDALPEVPDPLTRTDRNAAPYDVTVTPTDEPEEYNVSLLLRPSTGIPPTTPAVVLQPIAISVLEGDQQLTITLNDSGSQNHTGIELELDAVAVTGSPFAPGYSDPIVITGLTNDQAYSLTGRTTDGTNDSATTTESATPSAGGSAVDLQQPTNVQGSGTNQAVNVSFTNNSQNESGHEYSLDGTNWVAVPNSAGVGNIRITGLTNDQAYSGFIRPVDGSTKGPQSAQWFATPKANALGLTQSFWNPTVFVPAERGPANVAPGPMQNDQLMPTPYGYFVDWSRCVPPYYGSSPIICAWSEVGVNPPITDLPSFNAAISAGRSQGFNPDGDVVGTLGRQPLVNVALKPSTTYQFAIGPGSSSAQNISAVRTFTTLDEPNYQLPPVGEVFGFPKSEADQAKAEYLAGDSVKVGYVNLFVQNVNRVLSDWYGGEYMGLGFALCYYMSGNTVLRDEVRRLTLNWAPKSEGINESGDEYRRLTGNMYMKCGEMIGWDYGVSAADNAEIKNRLFAKIHQHDEYNVNFAVGNHGVHPGLAINSGGDEDQQAATIDIIMANALIMRDDPTYGAAATARLEKMKRAFFGSLLPRMWRANAQGNSGCHAGGRVAMNPEYSIQELVYYMRAFNVARSMAKDYMSQFAEWAYKAWLANDVYSVVPGGGGHWFYNDLDDYNPLTPKPASTFYHGWYNRGWGGFSSAMQMGILFNEGFTTEARYLKRGITDRSGPPLSSGLIPGNTPDLSWAVLYDGDGISGLPLPESFDQTYLDAGFGQFTAFNGVPLDQNGPKQSNQALFFGCMDSARHHALPTTGMVSYWHDGRMHISYTPYTRGKNWWNTHWSPILRINGAESERTQQGTNSFGQKLIQGSPWWKVAEDVSDEYALCVNETGAYFHNHRRLVLMVKANRTTGSPGGFIVVDRVFRQSSEPAITQLSQNWPMMLPIVGTMTPLIGNSGPFAKVADITTEQEQWEIPGIISNDITMATSFVVNGPLTNSATINVNVLELRMGTVSVDVNKDTLELV